MPRLIRKSTADRWLLLSELLRKQKVYTLNDLIKRQSDFIKMLQKKLSNRDADVAFYKYMFLLINQEDK